MGERGHDAADGTVPWVVVGDDAVEAGGNGWIALPHCRDDRTEHSAKGADGSIDEPSVAKRFAELVATEPAAGAADEDDGLDGLGGHGAKGVTGTNLGVSRL